MSELSAEQIAQRALDLNLVDDRQLSDVWNDLPSRSATAEEFLQVMVRRELLTNYQVERLIKGERSGFFYGPYKVLYRVATGSFARVYRAVEPATGKVVALKVLRRRYYDDPAMTEQFYREGELGRSLRHPNIVPIFEVVSKGTAHYLVMEFVEGNNLRDFVRVRRKLAPDEAVKLMSGIAAGLHYAFERKTCHRDLKMTNALVSTRGVAKLIDFGLASTDNSADDDEAGNLRTIDYAGLERASGVRKDDMRSDVYFMGCIFYHMLTGVPPLEETKGRVIRFPIERYTQVVPIHTRDASLPRVVSLIVNRAMELDANKRYQSPGEMLLDLQVAAKKLAAGSDIDESAAADGQLASDKDRRRMAAMLIPAEQRKALMFVENNPKMQDVFREGLKKIGYRVLVTSDPSRALERFEDDQQAAACVIFSTGTLGVEALSAFNKFGKDEKTAEIPAVLLLGQNQHAWAKKARRADHRVVVGMPLKLRQLRILLTKLVPPIEQATQP